MNTTARAGGRFGLSGRVVLVTGAGGGIGAALALAIGEAGAHVVVHGRDELRLADTMSALAAIDASATAVAFDLDRDDEIADGLAEIEATCGPLDALVNNAGVRDRRPLDELDRDAVERVLRTNVVAPFELARRLAPSMRRRGRGSIVNVTSIAGPIARGDVAYTASKGALDAMTRALAAELGPSGVRVNSVAPGFIATEANAAMVADPAIAERLRHRTSLGRWGEPAELGGAVVFLLSDAASYVTGHTLVVDGGYLTHF